MSAVDTYLHVERQQRQDVDDIHDAAEVARLARRERETHDELDGEERRAYVVDVLEGRV